MERRDVGTVGRVPVSAIAGFCVVGDGKRYAIDNYILDPIYVAFLLIRERVAKSEDMGLGRSVTFTQLHTLVGKTVWY